MTTTYARTDAAGQVTQWPVLPAHIAGRGLPARFYEPVKPTPKPRHDRLTHSVAQRKPTRDASGDLVQTWEVVPRQIEDVRAEQHARLADYRWRQETGGVDLPSGQRIQTTREAQAQISSTYSSLKDGLVASADWKAEGGWVSVTLTEFQPVAQAVADHVQRCFSAEKAVGQQIDAATTVDELAQIDLAAAFSAAYAA